MRTPHKVNASVAPRLVETATFQDSSNGGAFGQGIGQSLQKLGVDVVQASQVLGQKEKANKNFRQLSAMTSFENNINEKLIEAKRNAPVDGKGYLDSVNNMYDKEQAAFLANEIDPEDRDQFAFRTDQIKQRVVGDSLDFQYKASDSYFRQGISDELNKAQTKIALDPAATDAERARVFEMVDTQTDLSDIEKAELKRNINVGLLKTEYITTARDAQIATGVSSGGVAQGFVNKVIGVESGGNANAKNPNSSAEGVGQFIDSTWASMIKKYRPDIARGMSNDDLMDLKRDPKLGAEMTLRYAEENQRTLEQAGITPTEGGLYLAHFLGPADATKVLRAAPGTPVRDLVSAASIKANASVFANIETAEQLQAWAGKKMGSASSKIMSDPRYADIPFEDKMALQEDADRQAKQAIAQRNAEAKAAYDSKYNSLMLGIIDNKVGMADIQNARDEGWLKDAEDVSKAMNMVKAKNKDFEVLIAAGQKLANPSAAWTGDGEDQKMLNASVGKQGLEALVNGDQSYFTNGIIPLVTKTNVIPSDVLATLGTQVRGNNQQRALDALDMLSQLEDVNPRAYAAQTNDALAFDVSLYRDRRGTLPADELMKMINPPLDAAGLNIQKELRKGARTILAERDASTKLPAVDNIINEYQDTVGGQVANIGGARQGLNREFSTLFEDAYVKTGNVETATKMSLEALGRTWGVTSIGGQNTLMKNPPEKSGYPALSGGFNWIDRQARQELKLESGQKYELLSDGQTQREYDIWKGGPKMSGLATDLAEKGGLGGPFGGMAAATSAALTIAAAPPRPSYRIVVYDDAGVPNAKMIDGQPMRMNFTPDTMDVIQDSEDKNWTFRRTQLHQVLDNYRELVGEGLYTDKEIPPEETKEYDDALKELQEMQQYRPSLRNPEEFRSHGEVDFFSTEGQM